MDEWKKLNKTSLPEKDGFYSNWSIEDITVEDYMLAKRVCKDYEIKKLGGYHDSFIICNTLFLADVFENFRNIRLNILHLDPGNFFQPQD